MSSIVPAAYPRLDEHLARDTGVGGALLALLNIALNVFAVAWRFFICNEVSLLNFRSKEKIIGVRQRSLRVARQIIV